jgi:hypothetical protein
LRNENRGEKHISKNKVMKMEEREREADDDDEEGEDIKRTEI